MHESTRRQLEYAAVRYLLAVPGRYLIVLRGNWLAMVVELWDGQQSTPRRLRCAVVRGYGV